MKFYVLNGEPFIPEAINPVFALSAKATIKIAKINLAYQMRATSLQKVAKTEDKEKMLELMQKAFDVNGKKYNEYMEMSGVTLGEVDDSFFEDKDVEFFKNQIAVLCDFAAISAVIEKGLFAAMAAVIKNKTGLNTDQHTFFTNQTEIIPVEAEAEAETQE